MQTLTQRATLRLIRSQPLPKRRPVPYRLAIVLVACVIVPVIVAVVELVRGWMA